MSTDERKQSEALLVVWVVAALWLSHYVTLHFSNAPGNVDLRQWLRFWNKPLWVNWITAIAIFLAGILIGKRFMREMTAHQLRRKEGEARWLAGQTGKPRQSTKYRPIR